MEKIVTNDIDLMNAYVVELTSIMNDRAADAALARAQHAVVTARLEQANKRIAELEALIPKDSDPGPSNPAEA